MYIEWESPPPNPDADSIRALMLDFHNKITSTGTDCTQVDTPTVTQFDFETGTIEISNGSTFNKPIAPLIYKYAPDGYKTLYIKLQFYSGGWTSYGINTSITSRLGVWDSLEDCLLSADYSGYSVYCFMRNIYYGGIPATTYPSMNSLISNNDGVLSIFLCMGYSTTYANDYNKSILFLHVQATEKGYVRLYERNTSASLNYSGSEISSGYHNPSIMHLHEKSVNVTSLNTVNINNVVFSPVFQLKYQNINSNLVDFKNTYYYNRNINDTNGITTIGDKKMWAAGDRLRYYNIMRNDSASLLIEVTE